MKLPLPKWLYGLLPTTTKVVVDDTRFETPAIAHTLDADRLSSILRSAEAGNMEDYFGLCRDVIGGHTHAQAEFGKRKLAVIGKDTVFSPDDENRPAAVALAEEIERQVTQLPNWMDIELHLLDSTLYPLSIVEKIYRPSDRPGVRYELAELRPVPYRLIDYTEGRLMLWDVDDKGQRLATRHCPDPTRYMIHRGHALTSLPDTWGGPMRAVLFWYFFSVADRSWWARFLDRFGAPFMEASYDESDDAARLTLSRAFSAATKLFGIAVPKSVELKMHQANSSQGGDAFEKFHAVANEEMSKAIVGQTLSATGQNLGLGGGQAAVQENVRDDIREFDSKRLAHTLKTQLFVPICQMNGWFEKPPTIQWGGESSDDLAITSDFLSALPNAGLQITDEGIKILSKRSGLPLERLPAGTPPLSGLPLAAGVPRLRDLKTSTELRTDRLREANDAIARSGAEEFAQAMHDSLAPVRSILAASASMDDFERRLREEFPGIPSRKAAEILAAAMISNAANAILEFPTPAQS
jgi:phage gp29-like protein